MNEFEQKLINEYDSNLPIESLNIDKSKILNPVSLDKVFDKIVKVEGDVKIFQDKFSKFTQPTVDSHWYRLGNVTAAEVNSALSKIIDFTKEGFKLVSDTDLSQSENIKNLCILVAYLAIAEGKMYSQFQALTSDSDTAIDIMAEFEQDLREIAESGGDTQENVRQVALTLGQILEEKNKQVFALKSTFDKWREEEANQRFLLSNEINQLSADTLELANSTRNVLEETIQEKFNDVRKSTNEAFNLLKKETEQKDTDLRKYVELKMRKTIFDSVAYKIIIGVIAISALVISLI